MELSAEDTYGIIIMLTCLVGSGFFSSTETAVTSLDKLKVKHIIQVKGSSANSLKLWQDHPDRVLATVLIFNNIVNILASAVATDMAFRYFENQAVSIATGVTTFLVLIFGEIIPKSFAKAHAETVALFSMKIINIIYAIFKPIIIMFASLATGVVNTFAEQKNDQDVTEEQLEFMIDEGHKAGVIKDLKKEIIEGAFDFDETRVKEIITPRPALSVLSSEQTYKDALKLTNETGHSRIPVYGENIDQIVGIVFAKDMLVHSAKTDNPDDIVVTKFMREAFFAPEAATIMQLFKDLKRTKNHLAVIIDEYGGTAGIVTMEDILEEIVGEIQDEFDTEENDFIEVKEGVFEVAGSVNVHDFYSFFGINEDTLSEQEKDHESDTIAGWLTDMTDKMPEVGQKVTLAKLDVEVIKIDTHRIDRIKVTKKLSFAKNPHGHKSDAFTPAEEN
jgi:CBS domain containing-hemolysin-like protein